MKRYLETFFRYWLIVLVPIIVLPLFEANSLRHAPHQVYASLNIYTETPMVDPSSSSAYSYMSPAQIEASVIEQWLQSPNFCLSVAKSSPRYARLLALAPNPLSSASSDLAANVQVIARGTNLVTIGYTATDSQLAMQVVQSVLNRATDSSRSLQANQASTSRSYYEYQMGNAQAQERDSAGKLAAYMQHHSITADILAVQMAADPTLAGLYEQNKSDHETVSSLRSKIQSLQAQSSASATVLDQSGYVVADPPQYNTVSSRKKLYTGLGIAVALGLLLGIAIVVALTAFDHTLRLPEEVPAMLELPVLAIVPYSQAFARHWVGATDAGDRGVDSARAKGATAS